MTDARVNQLAREVLRDGPAPVRVVQIAREVLHDGGAAVRLAQVSRQVLQDATGRVRVAQVSRQVLRSRRDSPYPNFPVRLFCPPGLGVRLEGGLLDGGASPAGDQAVEAMTGGARWVMAFTETPLWTRDQVQAWRAYATAADFGAMNLIIPLWDRLYQPFADPAYAGSTSFGRLTWRDTPVWEADEVQAVIATPAARFATSLRFSFAGGTLTGGEHFSIYGPRYGWRLYRLIRRTAADETGQTWEIRPPLREWVDAGVGLNFDSPRCTMRVEGDMSEVVDLLRLGRGQATFVESFNRYP